MRRIPFQLLSRAQPSSIGRAFERRSHVVQLAPRTRLTGAVAGGDHLFSQYRGE